MENDLKKREEDAKRMREELDYLSEISGLDDQRLFSLEPIENAPFCSSMLQKFSPMSEYGDENENPSALTLQVRKTVCTSGSGRTTITCGSGWT